MKVPNLTRAQRARLYEVAIGVIGVLVVKGLLTGDEGAAWLLLLAPVLGVARRNVPTAD